MLIVAGAADSKQEHAIMDEKVAKVVQVNLYGLKNVGRKLVYQTGDSGKNVREIAVLALSLGLESVPVQMEITLMNVMFLYKKPRNATSIVHVNNGQIGENSRVALNAGTMKFGL